VGLYLLEVVVIILSRSKIEEVALGSRVGTVAYGIRGSRDAVAPLLLKTGVELLSG
jgi:hypothetical protein